MFLIPEKNFNTLRNPYHFKSFNFCRVQLSSDIHTNIQPITCDFDKNDYMEAYSSLQNASNIFFADKSNGISRKSFVEGYTIIG